MLSKNCSAGKSLYRSKVSRDTVDINSVTESRRIADNDSVRKDVLTRATLRESHGAQSNRSKGLTYDSGTTKTANQPLEGIRSCGALR